MVLEMYQQLHPRNQTGASQTQGFPVIYTICIKKFEPPQYQSAVTAQSLALLSPLSSGSAVAILRTLWYWKGLSTIWNILYTPKGDCDQSAVSYVTQVNFPDLSYQKTPRQ